MPFREAHGVVARLSTYAIEQGKQFHELPLDVYHQFSELFDEDVYKITVESSVRARDVPGGTGFSQVARAIANARATIEGEHAT